MAKGHKKFLSVSHIVLAVLIFCALNVGFNMLLPASRLDLTEDKIYTLSDGTASFLDALEEPIRLRFFYSKEQANGYPVIQNYAQRMRGLLKQYVSKSNGMVTLEEINPKSFSEEEDLAVSLGVAGAGVDALGNKLYFGLAATNSTDDLGTIPFFDPDKAAYVEYDMTRMLHDLAHPEKPKVGVLSWLNMHGGGITPVGAEPEWVLMTELEKQFDVVSVDTKAKAIPDDVKVLLVVHPPAKDVDYELQYAIDQYVLKGGRAIIFTDPYTRASGSEHSESNLKTLYNNWGIEMPETDIAADPSIAIRIMDERQQSALSNATNPVWLNLQARNMNSADLVAADLKVIRYIAGGHFKPMEGTTAKTQFMPILLTNPQSFTVSNYQMMFNTDPTVLLDKATPTGGERLVLAGRITGEATSAFPEYKDSEGHVATSQKPINVIVVGDTDMLRDGFWVNRQNFFGKEILVPTANNGAFVLNAVDNMAGASELIKLRSRIVAERPFDAVQEIQRQAEVKFRARESELQHQLRELEQKLDNMQVQSTEEGELLFTPEQEDQFNGFQTRLLDTRKELRAVQRALEEDIQALGMRLKILNIALAPLLVLMLAWFLPRRLGMKRA